MRPLNKLIIHVSFEKQFFVIFPNKMIFKKLLCDKHEGISPLLVISGMPEYMLNCPWYNPSIFNIFICAHHRESFTRPCLSETHEASFNVSIFIHL